MLNCEKTAITRALFSTRREKTNNKRKYFFCVDLIYICMEFVSVIQWVNAYRLFSAMKSLFLFLSCYVLTALSVAADGTFDLTSEGK